MFDINRAHYSSDNRVLRAAALHISIALPPIHDTPKTRLPEVVHTRRGAVWPCLGSLGERGAASNIVLAPLAGCRHAKAARAPHCGPGALSVRQRADRGCPGLPDPGCAPSRRVRILGGV